MKVANKRFFREKSHQNLELLRVFFSKSKTEKCNQSNLSVSDQFGMVISFSATFVLEVTAQVSLKVATKCSFRGKKT